MLAQGGLMLAVLALGPAASGTWDFTGRATLGWLLAGLGAVAGVAGAWVLGRNRTMFPHPRAGSVLIQHGIYAILRHPLYTSVMALSLSWGLLWRSGLALLGAAGLVLLLDRKARREEASLGQHFPAYHGYARHVRRFVPWFY